MFTGAFLGEFLIGVGTATGIAALLAVVMVIADATIANYGEVKVTVNDGARELTVEGRPAAALHPHGRGHLHPLRLRRQGLLRPVQGDRSTDGAGEYSATELPVDHRGGGGKKRPPVLPGQGEAGHGDPDPRGAVQHPGVQDRGAVDPRPHLRHQGSHAEAEGPGGDRPAGRASTSSSWCRPTSSPPTRSTAPTRSPRGPRRRTRWSWRSAWCPTGSARPTCSTTSRSGTR